MGSQEGNRERWDMSQVDCSFAFFYLLFSVHFLKKKKKSLFKLDNSDRVVLKLVKEYEMYKDKSIVTPPQHLLPHPHSTLHHGSRSVFPGRMAVMSLSTCSSDPLLFTLPLQGLQEL